MSQSIFDDLYPKSVARSLSKSTDGSDHYVADFSNPGEPFQSADDVLNGSSSDSAVKQVEQVEQNALAEDAGTKQDNSVKIIIFGMIIIGAIIGGAFGFIEIQKHENDESSSGSGTSDSENIATGDEFAVSSDQLREVQELLATANPENRWSGAAAATHSDQSSALSALASQMADVNSEAHATVQKQGTQVGQGRASLDDTLNELGFAIPVAQSLYYSGAAGPALSYHFQLAVSSSSVNTGVDTASDMHDKACENAVRLDTLNQNYHQLLAALTSDN